IRTLSAGLGSVGLAGMFASGSPRAAAIGSSGLLPLSYTPGKPHFTPRAKHNIVLFLPGGPSQVDLFDPKPALEKFVGQRPDSVNLRTERTTGGLYPSPFKFKRHGKSGLEVSGLLPQLSSL